MRSLFIAVLFSSGLVYAAGENTSKVEAPKDAHVFFANLKDGETVASPLTIKFGVKNIKIRSAGEDANDHLSGHHHLIIDGKAVPEGEVVNKSDKSLHFGKGETETKLTLPKGPHTLTLQFADGAHRSYGEAMSTTIHINVK